MDFYCIWYWESTLKVAGEFKVLVRKNVIKLLLYVTLNIVFLLIILLPAQKLSTTNPFRYSKVLKLILTSVHSL
jgi:hypothetical protein